jgi:predicted lipid-binding transport protein (Tim44 family)
MANQKSSTKPGRPAVGTDEAITASTEKLANRVNMICIQIVDRGTSTLSAAGVTAARNGVPRETIEKAFKAIQEAWTARDRDRLATMVGPDLMKEWSLRLDDFDRKGWHNVVEVKIPPGNTIRFKPGKELRNLL